MRTGVQARAPEGCQRLRADYRTFYSIQNLLNREWRGTSEEEQSVRLWKPNHPSPKGIGHEHAYIYPVYDTAPRLDALVSRSG